MPCLTTAAPRAVARPHIPYIDSSHNSNSGPFLTGAAKNSPGRQLRRNTNKKIKKTVVCAVKYSGQGRGRTADLPIFRTTVIRSRLFATVLDQRRKLHPDIGERRRTKTNETEKETTPEPPRLCLCLPTAAAATCPARPAGGRSPVDCAGVDALMGVVG
jgi:hypothetical protein